MAKVLTQMLIPQNPEGLKKALEQLRRACNYETPPPEWNLPKYIIRLSLLILAIGFLGLGISSYIVRPQITDQFVEFYMTIGNIFSVIAGGAFLTIAIIL
jgi:hypothetical protein